MDYACSALMARIIYPGNTRKVSDNLPDKYMRNQTDGQGNESLIEWEVHNQLLDYSILEYAEIWKGLANALQGSKEKR